MIAKFVAAGVAGLIACGPLAAQDLRMGVAIMTTSVDPHWHNLGTNNGLLQQIYEPLVMEMPDGRLEPRLATAWRAVDDTTWEIDLRADAKFHDGTPFVPQDIAFTFARVPEVPNSPGRYSTYTRVVTAIEVISPTKVRMRTAAPHALLPRDLAYVMILSSRVHDGKKTEDFNAGSAAIGTGPYRFEGYTPGEELRLVRNDGYWGQAEPWQRVTVRQLRADNARVAAVLAGDVDVIDRVPLQDLARVRAARGIAVASSPAAETYYLFPDAVREQTPFVTARDGSPLPANPLRDVRVRRALSMAINRDAMVARVMDGSGSPASQLVAPGIEGADTTLPPIPYDPDGAKKLLAEAGYPDGFTLTLHGSTAWVVNDARVLQAIAAMLPRIGVEVKIETFPANVLLPRATNREFSLFFASWIASTAMNPLRSLVATRDAAAGMGSANRQHYSNPRFDAVLAEALSTMDMAVVERKMAEAMRIAMEDVALIPMIHPANNWATRADHVTYGANARGINQAMLAKPVR